ncbi:gfo/Idh/MocA family oxidoreductase, partial [Stenotrophomonas maltophilia]
AASAAVAASSLQPQTPAWARGRHVRLAMIGTGLRGLVLLKELVRRDAVEVVARGDGEPLLLGRALAMGARAGR